MYSFISSPQLYTASLTNPELSSPHQESFQEEFCLPVLFRQPSKTGTTPGQNYFLGRKAVKPQEYSGFKINLISHNNINVPLIFLSVQIIKYDIEPNVKSSVHCISTWCCFLLNLDTDVFHLIWRGLFLKQEPGEGESSSFRAFRGTLALQRQLWYYGI